MVGDTVLDAELAEPTIGKIHLHFGADTRERLERPSSSPQDDPALPHGVAVADQRR
jgi:hypothetical protein